MGLAYMRISVVVNKTRFIPELFFCVFVFLYLYLCTFLSVFVLVKGRYVQLCRSLVYYGSHSERVQIRDSLSARALWPLLILLLPTADQMFLPPPNDPVCLFRLLLIPWFVSAFMWYSVLPPKGRAQQLCTFSNLAFDVVWRNTTVGFHARIILAVWTIIS